MSKKIVLTNEELQELIGSVSVLATDSNKVRFTVGPENNGQQLAGYVKIVDGGAMLQKAFITAQMKDVASLVADKQPYMAFILKAREFVTNAGALLSYKADVTITEEEGRVVFSCSNGSRVPCGKVAADAAEPLLEQDYADGIAYATGEKIAGALIRGSVPASSDSGSCTAIIREAEGGATLDVYGLQMTGGLLAHYGCPLQLKWRDALAKPADEQKADEQPAQPAVTAQKWLISWVQGQPDEVKQKVMAEVAPIANDPEKVREYAAKLGWKPEVAASAAPEVKAAHDDLYFGLSPAACTIISRIIQPDDKNVAMVVTPKNVHIKSGKTAATFARTNPAKGPVDTVKSFIEKADAVARVVVDKGALVGSLNLMKLGDESKPFALKGGAKGLTLSKEQEGITSKVPALEQEGELSALSMYFSHKTFSAAIRTMKAGNVVLKYCGGERLPIIIGNGGLTDAQEGYVAVMRCNPDAAGSGEEAKEKQKKASKKAEKSEETAEAAEAEE